MFRNKSFGNYIYSSQSFREEQLAQLDGKGLDYSESESGNKLLPEKAWRMA